jgi:hypothetical protein
MKSKQKIKAGYREMQLVEKRNHGGWNKHDINLWEMRTGMQARNSKKKSYTETLSRQLTWTTNVFYMLDFRLVEDYSNSTSYLLKLK